MARNNHLSPKYKERLQVLNPSNKSYIEKFLNSEHGDEKSYISQTFRFAEYFNDKAIDQIKPEEIVNYLANIDGAPAHIVNVARYLISFLKRLPGQETNILQLEKIAQEKQKEIENKEPINLDDVITFRNNLIAHEDFKTLFVFEMLYVYGLEWNDFDNMTEEDYLPSTGELITKSKGKIKLPKNLQILLNGNSEILKPKSYRVLSGYLRDASIIFENRITETVIEATRNKYFPTCQRCNNQYPNTSEHWALVECKDDSYHKQWLLCLSCAKEVGG